ncbi:hypothetical protein AB0953_27530 [Streptomyces sp. NPDC046866]|uniref:hypothetical protein n=1 Tax=Streptomyces sp. NPDC046866 TaxID=3154921 RepID=UPI0034519D11
MGDDTTNDDACVGEMMFDENDHALGRVESVREDKDGHRYAVLKLPYGHRAPIPLERVTRERNHLKVAYDERRVFFAPTVHESRSLTDEETEHLDEYYNLVRGEYKKPLDIAYAYKREKLDRDATVKMLADWAYIPGRKSDEPAPDLLDDPPVWPAGTIHDVETALDLGWIDERMYDEILELMSVEPDQDGSGQGDLNITADPEPE